MKTLMLKESDETATDSLLLKRYVEADDQRAFAQIVQRYGGLAHGVAARTLNVPGGAEDVVQLTFLELAKQARKLSGISHLPRWIHRTAYHKSLDAN